MPAPIPQRLRGLAAAARGVRAPRNGNRSTRFRQEPNIRFWWHKLHRTDYVPPLYSHLSDDEWALMEAWYAETEAQRAVGEINVPAMSLMQGLIMGNGLYRIVQLGHYYGYSTLLIGMMLRSMGGDRRLVSVDISPEATSFTQEWVDRAGLSSHVRLHLGDSADPAAYNAAAGFLGDSPELLVIDSSHQYAHTLRELDMWVPRMSVGSMVLMHDTSAFATQFDSTGEGGVRRALAEWLPEHPEVSFVNVNGHVSEGVAGDGLVYKDGCGIGIMQLVA